MESRTTYIDRLRQALAQAYECSVEHQESVRVHEVFRAQKVWDGTVEVFRLVGHPTAERAYAWSHLGGRFDASAQFISYLGTAKIDSPAAAVRASLRGDLKDET